MLRAQAVVLPSRDNKSEVAMASNNVHIPDELLSEITAVARADGKTPDDLLAEAARQMLEHRALDQLAERGRAHADRVGRPDPVKAVRDIRHGP
jgi:hypothetical protein